MLNKLIKELSTLQYYLQDHTTYISRIIEKHGQVMMLQKGDRTAIGRDDLIHDYVIFCYTKGVRSLMAVDILLTEGFLEDATIILRSVYECYINANFVIHNPDKIDDLIELKIGEYFGVYSHPVSKKGNVIRKKLIHPQTNEILDFSTSIAKMASNTGNEWDTKGHHYLYSYLSEFTHVHMIASGAYRNESKKWYSVEPAPELAFSAISLSAFVSWLLFDSALKFLESREFSEKALKRELRKNSNYISKIFSQMEFENRLNPLRDILINRLKNE